jgi:hypothetical protein
MRFILKLTITRKKPFKQHIYEPSNKHDIKSFAEAILGEGQTATAIPNMIKGNPLEDVLLQNIYRINFAAIYLEIVVMWYMMLQNEDKTEMSRIFNSERQTLAGAEVVPGDTLPLI